MDATTTETRPAAKFIGTCDDVTTCECCGRSDLKSTVALMLDGALDPVYFGVTCAAHALKRSVKEIRTGARDADRERERAAAAERTRLAAIEDARWQSFLDAHAPQVLYMGKPDRLAQIQSLGGYAAARARYLAA